MSEYIRFVSYVYSYQQDTRKNNVGYLKFESRSGVKRFYIQLSGIRNIERLSVYLFYRDFNTYIGIPIGTMYLHGQRGEFQYGTCQEMLGENECMLQDICGVILLDKKWQSSGIYYCTLWEDIPFSINEFVTGRENLVSLQAAGIEAVSTTKSAVSAMPPEEVPASSPETLPEIPGILETPIPQEVPVNMPAEVPQGVPTPSAIPASVPELPEEQELPEEVPETVPVSEPVEIPGKVPEKIPVSVPEVIPEAVPEVTPVSVPETEPEVVPELMPAEVPEAEPAALGKEVSEPVSAAISETEAVQNMTSELHDEIAVSSQTADEPVAAQGSLPTDSLTDEEILQLAQEKLQPRVRWENHVRENHISGKWSSLCKMYPKVRPFPYDPQTQCLKIKPGDLGRLPRENWGFANNSFLLHSFYQYRYILLMRREEDGRMKYMIGVPGTFSENERFMAEMFGFEEFQPSPKAKLEEDGFGYWMVELSMANEE